MRSGGSEGKGRGGGGGRLGLREPSIYRGASCKCLVAASASRDFRKGHRVSMTSVSDAAATTGALSFVSILHPALPEYPPFVTRPPVSDRLKLRPIYFPRYTFFL